MPQYIKKSKDDYVQMQRRLNNQIVKLFDIFFDFLMKENECQNIFLKNWNLEPKFLWARG